MGLTIIHYGMAEAELLEIDWLKDWEDKFHKLIKELRDLMKKEEYPSEDFEEVRRILLSALEDVKEYLVYYSFKEWGGP